MVLFSLDGRVPALLVSAAAAAAAVLLFVRLFSAPTIRRNGIPLRSPPGTLPLLGNGLAFLLRPRLDLFALFSSWERRSGRETLQLRVPSIPPAVLIHDPRVLEYVFRHEGAVFSKGEFVRRRSRDLFGRGIINADGELWRAQRRAGLEFLSAANLKVLIEVALPRHLEAAARTLADAAAEGAVSDLQAIFLTLTTGLMGRMAYNMDMSGHGEFTAAFEYASAVTADRFQNPLWRLKEAVAGRRARRALRAVRAFGAGMVEKAVLDRQRQQPSDGPGRAGTLIQALLGAMGDDRQATAEAALNYLSAGRDTTAQALTWAFYLLASHSRVLAQLRQAARRVLGTQASRPGLPGAPSFGFHPTLFTPASMPYATAVFYETLRLYPPVPFEIKQAKKSTVLPDGTLLPSGAVVAWCPWSMGRSRATWGEDADAFRPDRWLHADGTVAGRSQAEFPVFNGGARVCLGKRMAELMAVQVITTVALLFDLAPAHPGARPTSGSSLTLPMDGGFPCHVTERTVLERAGDGRD